MRKLFCTLIFLVPLLTVAQPKDISGVWKLKEKKSLAGPDYYNGVPRILKVQQSDSITELEITLSVNNKDTIEVERLSHGAEQQNVSKTLAGRKKIVSFNWDETQGGWIKQSNLFSKNDPDKEEISINESYLLSGQGSELVLLKNYKADKSSRNQNYVMQGVYKKTSEVELARETATGNGVRFEGELSWDQILIKAKKENKYIFIDCYATWCGPCKKMDREVFNLNIVGEAMNEKFISLKVQMDTGKNDDDNIKFRYPLARKIETEYNISSLPTYLFFDQNGKIVHKAIGAHKPEEFILLVANSRDTAAQLYTLISKARLGQLHYSEMAMLANRLFDMKETVLSKEIARQYFVQYLYNLSEKDLYKKTHGEFIDRFKDVVSSKDKIFKLFLSDPEQFDKLFEKRGLSNAVVESVVYTEEISPLLVRAHNTGKSPNWKVMRKNIAEEIGIEWADRLLNNLKVSWYKRKKEWKSYCAELEKNIELQGDITKIHWLNLNLTAWQMFLYSKDKKKLEKALYWSEFSIKNQMNDTTVKKAEVPWLDFLDTYANILYKLGRTEEALIYYKEKVLGAAPESKLYKETFNKMKMNIPTWIKDGAK